VTYEEYLELPVSELEKLAPADICPHCVALGEPRVEFSSWGDPVYIHYDPDVPTNATGCGAWRIYMVRQGYADRLPKHEETKWPYMK
jgi:hypothetical protein